MTNDATTQKSLLAKYLYMIQHAGSTEKRQLAASIPDNVRTFHNGKLVKVKELLMTDNISATNLVQREVFAEVTRGAQYATCFRNIVSVYKTTSDAPKVPLDDADTYAGEVPEGGEIPGYTGSISATTFTVKKYGIRPQITRELVNDAAFDIVANRINRAGRAIENTLNRVILTNYLDNAGNLFDTDGSNQGIKAIASASGLIREDGFMPDGIVMHPSAYAMVLRDFIPGSWEDPKMLATGTLPSGLLGLKVGVCGVAEDSSSYVWSYSADNDIGMLVLDTGACGKIMMREDIRVEQFFDPIRDLHNLCCTIRFGHSYENANAIARVRY